MSDKKSDTVAGMNDDIANFVAANVAHLDLSPLDVLAGAYNAGYAMRE